VGLLLTDVPEFDRFRIGTTFTFGYNTFNFHLYYNLNTVFKNVFLNEEQIGIHAFKIGLMSLSYNQKLRTISWGIRPITNPRLNSSQLCAPNCNRDVAVNPKAAMRNAME